MAEIILVRHGKTAGNLEGRYIGSRTDEPLCEEGIHALEEKVREGGAADLQLLGIGNNGHIAFNEASDHLIAVAHTES